MRIRRQCLYENPISGCEAEGCSQSREEWGDLPLYSIEMDDLWGDTGFPVTLIWRQWGVPPIV